MFALFDPVAVAPEVNVTVTIVSMILSFLGTCLSAIIGYLMWKSSQTTKVIVSKVDGAGAKVDDLHNLWNSRLAQLIETIRRESHATGKLEGIAIEQARVAAGTASLPPPAEPPKT
jgi:hypothetical protein